jgi:GNAT superfamily N-acetyltransferase
MPDLADDEGVVVRVATIDDASDLARLRFDWRSEERGERGLDRPSFDRAFRSWMLDHQRSHLAFLVRRRGRTIGMAWLALVDRVPGPQYRRRSAYVQSVYIEPGARSGGIGTRLMECVLTHARTLDLDYLAVHPSERAFSLYERLGLRRSDGVLELREYVRSADDYQARSAV